MNSKATAFSRSQLYACWLRPVLHLPREVGCRDAAAWHTAPKSTTLVDSLGPDNNGEIIAFVHMCSRPKGGGSFSSSDSEWEHTTHPAHQRIYLQDTQKCPFTFAFTINSCEVLSTGLILQMGKLRLRLCSC